MSIHIERWAAAEHARIPVSATSVWLAIGVTARSGPPVAAHPTRMDRKPAHNNMAIGCLAAPLLSTPRARKRTIYRLNARQPMSVRQKAPSQ